LNKADLPAHSSGDGAPELQKDAEAAEHCSSAALSAEEDRLKSGYLQYVPLFPQTSGRVERLLDRPATLAFRPAALGDRGLPTPLRTVSRFSTPSSL